MQKLTYFAISHPEKLNRIAVYLVERLSRDLSRQRITQVSVAVDAMDQLLKSCHSSPSLNQFIESYLKMVQKLLETNDPDMEKLATNLFVRFSTIEENSPSYHREYDFFISKFSAMCHASRGDRLKQQRYNGLRGLRGVIWKSVADELQTSIWEKQHLTKVIPSILFNMQESEDNIEECVEQVEYPYPDEEAVNEEPHLLALQCLRELFGKCNFSMMKTVLDPILKHCDLHRKWEPPAQFATHVFKAILYSIQSSNSFAVLQELIYHLENTPNSEVYVRIGITTVLENIVTIAVATIGPLLLSIFNSLLKQLRASVEYENSVECVNLTAESQFQDALINTMGVFASTLPDYQKVEIMMFTVGNIPTIQHEDRPLKACDAYVQRVLMKTLLKIATKYRTFYLSTVFSDSFLQTLLQLSVTQNPEVRVISQKILHTLFDRHGNLPKLEHLQYVEDVSDLQLSIEKCVRQDQLFMNKNIHLILSALYTFAKMAESGEHLQRHLDALLCTMCLICVEIGHDMEVIELYRLCFGLQHLALDPEEPFSLKKRAGLHNVVAKYMNLSSQLLAIPMLCQHVQGVIQLRAQKGHHLLNILNDKAPISDPLDVGSSTPKAPIAQMDSEDDYTARPLGLETDSNFLFHVNDVAEALKSSNKNVDMLFNTFEVNKKESENQRVHKKRASEEHGRDSERNLERTMTIDNDDDDRSLSLDSFDWTPPDTDDDRPDNLSWCQKTLEDQDEVTFEQLRSIVNTEPDCSEETKKDQEKSREILSMFRNKNAQELSAVLYKPKESDDNTNALIKDLLKEHVEWLNSHESARANLIQSIDDIEFPKSFVN
uniref:Importin-11 n=2 Tax=Bursaphelenchus xylophilus TaxID=6326 RepID=A0A1I7SWP5_BURXY